MGIVQIVVTLSSIFLSCFLTHFLAKKRELKNKNEFKSNLDYVTQMDTYRNASQIEKDRFAQLVFNKKDITFQEFEYFIKYENADKWVNSYLLHKKYLRLERKNENVIKKIDAQYSFKKYFLLMVGFVLCSSIAILPLLTWAKYISFFQKNLESQDYLVPFNLVMYPLIFLVTGIIFINKAENLKNAKRFIKEFYKLAIKIE